MRSRPALLGTIAVVAVALGAATIAQEAGCNQTAHLALVKALAQGTVRIDRWQAETCDDSYAGGHYYSNKAPGLAFLTLPWHGLLTLFGEGPVSTARLGWPEAMHQMPRSSLWRETLWGAVLAALALLLLVRRVADKLVPGYGAIAAVTVGLATLVLPFSTLLFSHVAAALIGFAAFALLLGERGRPSAWSTGAAGLLAGIGIVVEYPQAIVAVALAGYAAARRPLVARLAAYCGGVVVGVTPLLVYNAVAFGSPFRLSYGSSVIGHHEVGVYGVGTPSLRVATEVLASGKGLLTLTPVVAAAAAGLVALYRRGHRAEAVLCGMLALLFVAYDSGFFDPFGGFVPGPRFLVPLLPFLALGLAAAYAERSAVVLALALPSCFFMTAATLTRPMIEEADPGPWFDALRDGSLTQSVVTLAAGTDGWPAMLPFLLLAASAAVLGVASLPAPRVRRADLSTAALTLLLWAVVYDAAPDLLGTDRVSGGSAGLVAALILLAASAAAVLLHPHSGRLVLLASAPMVVLAFPGVAGHTVVSAALAATSLALLVVAARDAGSAGRLAT